MDKGEKLTGLQFVREFAQSVSPLHLAMVAIVCGGMAVLDAKWFASGLHGIVAVVVAVSGVVLETALVLTMLSFRTVQEWVRNGWPKDS